MLKICCLVLIQLFISKGALAAECPYDYSANNCELLEQNICHFKTPIEVRFTDNLSTWGKNWTMIERVQRGQVYKAIGVHSFHIRYLETGLDKIVNRIIIHDELNEVSEFSIIYLKIFSIYKYKFTSCE